MYFYLIKCKFVLLSKIRIHARLLKSTPSNFHVLAFQEGLKKPTMVLKSSTLRRRRIRVNHSRKFKNNSGIQHTMK